MATISSTIELYDRISAPVNKIIGALNNMVGIFESVDSAMNNGFDPSTIYETRRAIDLASAQVRQLGEEIRQNEGKQDRFNREVNEGTDAMNGLMNSVKGVFGAYMGVQGLKKIADISDGYIQTEARLNMIVDQHNTIESLQNKIFASAQKSRASYADTADMVAKISMRTSDLFTNDEAILFAENLNKMYTIAGASAAEMKSSQLQLLQAMGSGVLRGEEFNAVYEAAPNIMQQVAKSMGKPITQLRKMASEGEITADIVKNALLNIPEETLTAFEEMPMTWAQVWTTAVNKVYRLSQPLLEFVNFLARNWSVLEPIVLGAASALGVYLVATKGVELATKAWASAQAILNTIMAMNPAYKVVLVVTILIALFYAVIAIINKCAKTTYSATGMIAGAFAVLGAYIWNWNLGMLDIVLWVVNTICNAFILWINFLGNVVNDGTGSIIHMFGSMGDYVLSILEAIASAWDKIFGTDFAGYVQNWRSSLDVMVEGAANKYGTGKYEKLMDEVNLSSESLGLKRWAYGDAYNTGYGWGKGVDDYVSGVFNGDWYKDIEQIEANTENIASSLDITNEDLKYLKDLAERDAINRFTTAEIKVDMTNNNSIGSNMDLDGIVDYLVVGVNEAMAIAAEGVGI